MTPTKQRSSKLPKDIKIVNKLYTAPPSGVKPPLPPRTRFRSSKEASFKNPDPYEQQAHDLTILYMQAHTDQWQQNSELDEIVSMYKTIYAEILTRLNGK